MLVSNSIFQRGWGGGVGLTLASLFFLLVPDTQSVTECAQENLDKYEQHPTGNPEPKLVTYPCHMLLLCQFHFCFSSFRVANPLLAHLPVYCLLTAL